MGGDGGNKIVELLTSPQLRKPFLIGTSLILFQQITGQPSVLYYATKIFNDAGFPLESATAVSVLLGVFKLLMTFVSVGVVESAGRRPLLLWGVSGMVASLVTLSFCTTAGESAAVGSVVASSSTLAATSSLSGPSLGSSTARFTRRPSALRPWLWPQC